MHQWRASISGAGALLLLLLCAPIRAQTPAVTPTDAQAAPESPVTTEPTKSAADDRKTWAIGARWALTDVGRSTQAHSIAPILGVRIGKLRIGYESDNARWLGTAVYSTEPGLAYDWLAAEHWRTSVSLRLHSVREGDADESVAPRHLTLRAWGRVSYLFSRRSSMNLELTQDLLGKGDGTTMAISAARTWRIAERMTASLGASVLAASATHWRTQYANHADAYRLGNGFGSTGLGVGWRWSPDKGWAIFANGSLDRAVGRVTDFAGNAWHPGLQVGVVRFGDF